jgi:hypothetical protein
MFYSGDTQYHILYCTKKNTGYELHKLHRIQLYNYGHKKYGIFRNVTPYRMVDV